MANVSIKHVQIDKNNARVVVLVAVAAFVCIFSLVACRALLSQRAYQTRVINEKTKALKQLKANAQASEQLVRSYTSFVAEPVNIIKGSSSGTGERDGDNAKIVLDALPSKYDFPALVASVEKMLSGGNFVINNITGTDDEINQTKVKATTPVEMPFSMDVSGNFTTVNDLVGVLQRSIRPMHVNKIKLTGDDGNLKVTLDAKTYYQPQRTLEITTKEVR